MPTNPYPSKTVEEVEQIRDEQAFIVHSSLLTLKHRDPMLNLRATEVVGREVLERMRAKWFPTLGIGLFHVLARIMPVYKSLQAEASGPPDEVTLAFAADVTVGEARCVGGILARLAAIDPHADDSEAGSGFVGAELLLFGLTILSVLELFLLASCFELYGEERASGPTIAAALNMTSEEVDLLEREMFGRLFHPVMARKLHRAGRR